MRTKTLLFVLATCVALVAVGGIAKGVNEETDTYQLRYGSMTNNSLLPSYLADFGGASSWSPGPPLSAWAVDETWQDSYFVKNDSGKAQVWSGSAYHPVDSVCTGPSADDDGVISWLCAADDTINITAEFELRQDHVPGGAVNGIDYYVYKQGKNGKSSELLLSGSIDGTQPLGTSTGTLTANNVSILAGNRILFGVGSQGNPAYDVTQVRGTITSGTVSWDVEVDYPIGTPVDPPDPPGQYLTENIPSFTLPSYSGTSYARSVPDTIDIQEMASLAVDGLTALTDSASDYEIYWVSLVLLYKPPKAEHDWNDSVGTKWTESLPLCRQVSGNMANKNTVEKRWAEVILHKQSPDDGLYYFPKIGKPWHNKSLYGPESPSNYYSIIYTNGRTLGAAMEYFKLTGDPIWETSAKNAIDGLIALATIKSGAASYDWLQYGLNGEYIEGEGQVHNLASWFSWLVGGAARVYEETGYAPALTFSGQLATWIKNKSGHFGSNGSWKAEAKGSSAIHFHGHTMSIVSLLMYAGASGDTAMRDWAESAYLYGRDHAGSVPLTGYFQEYLEGGGVLCESSGLSDMIAAAIKLSQQGAGDYWDDADRWIRNQFVESQLRDGSWIDDAVSGLPTSGTGFNETNTNVSSRLVGSWASNATGNDPVKSGTPGHYLGCCIGNCARTLYWIWDGMIEYAGGELKVNLLMNRASPWADIDSYIPFEGRVDIEMKVACDLSIRIPEWVNPGEEVVTVNGQARSVTFNGRYAELGAVAATDDVTITFPIIVDTRPDPEIMGGVSYIIVTKGNEVVDITPEGVYSPFYDREHYRNGPTQWKNVTRYYPD